MSSVTGTFLTALLAYFSIFSLGSLSGLLSERSGVVYISLDGKMIIGGLIMSLIYQIDGYQETMGWIGPILAMLLAGLFTALYATIFAYFTINLLSEQVVTGIAMNLIATSLALFIILSLPEGGYILSNVGPTKTFPGLINLTIFLMAFVSLFILIAFGIILSKTNFGLRLRSSGENPYALETAGISVKSTRWRAIMLAGFFSGIAGTIFVMNLGNYSGTVYGSGYLSIAILIVGQWTILGIGLASGAFALLMSVFAYLNISISYELGNAITYIIPLVILIFLKSSNSSPASLGKKYKKDMR